MYLFLGMFFACGFGVLALLLPGALAVGAPGAVPRALMLHELLYFSYTTLTTTGYGDITPVHPLARTVATFESITGSLYIAVMVARLVGLPSRSAGRPSPAD